MTPPRGLSDCTPNHDLLSDESLSINLMVKVQGQNSNGKTVKQTGNNGMCHHAPAVTKLMPPRNHDNDKFKTTLMVVYSPSANLWNFLLFCSSFLCCRMLGVIAVFLLALRWGPFVSPSNAGNSSFWSCWLALASRVFFFAPPPPPPFPHYNYFLCSLAQQPI